MDVNEAKLVVRPQDLRPMATQIVSKAIDRSTNLKIFKILRAAGKKVSTQKAGEGEADKGTNRRGFKVVIESSLEEKGKGLWHNIRAKRKRGERPAKPGEKGYPKTLDIESKEVDEASMQDIKGILTTIAKSQNMNQAVQMVMKKYKVDQGKAKAMVKKAIDSGVTYDKIKKKYAKESVELDEGYTVPRKDFEKLKKGDIVNVKFDSPVKKGMTYRLQVKSRSRSAKYNVDKVTMMDASDSRNRTKFSLYSRDGKDATLGWGDMGVTMVKFVKESLEEKAVSKSQQKFMGMVRATQKGDMKAPSPEVAKAAKSMSKKDVKDFASTKHKGLPEMKTFESVRRAMDIAKKSGGDMTGAVKKMDKIKKGVSDTPRVQKALKKANEGAMSKDKEKHDTGGFRISNADAKAARDRIMQKRQKSASQNKSFNKVRSRMEQQVDELSTGKLQQYKAKATADAANASRDSSRGDPDAASRQDKRNRGIKRAMKRLNQ